jgi:predicted PurR-regulated permease PerM
MVKKSLLPAAFIGLVIVIGLLALSFLASTFLPILIALLLAYIFDPLVEFLEKRHIRRSISIMVVFFVIIALLALLGVFFVTSIKAEFRNVQIGLPEYADRFYAWIPQPIKAYLGIETPEKVYRQINTGLESLRGFSFELFKESFAFVKKAFSSTLAFILAVLGYFITPIYLYYFLKDLHKMESGFLDLVPKRYRNTFVEKGVEINQVLSAFVRGQLALVVILSVLYGIGLYFIGIDLAIAIGTLAGVTFIIPYFGTILGIVFSVIMAVLKFHDFLHPALCLGWFGIVQLMEGSVITPKIVGSKVGLHPVVTIMSLLIGGQLFGIIGMLLAVPVAAIVKVFYRPLVDIYCQSAFYTGD